MRFDKIYAKRLLALAARLVTVPRKRFNYNRWVGDDWMGAQDLSCGTVACALGWATTMPRFRRLGLRLDWNRWLSTPESHGGRVILKLPGHRGEIRSPLRAAEIIFGPDTSDLFLPGVGEMHATPKQVAKKIRDYVIRRFPEMAKMHDVR